MTDKHNAPDQVGQMPPAGIVELTEDALDKVAGGPNRRRFDHIGNVIDDTPTDPLPGQPTTQFGSTAGGSPNV